MFNESIRKRFAERENKKKKICESIRKIKIHGNFEILILTQVKCVCVCMRSIGMAFLCCESNTHTSYLFNLLHS